MKYHPTSVPATAYYLFFKVSDRSVIHKFRANLLRNMASILHALLIEKEKVIQLSCDTYTRLSLLSLSLKCSQLTSSQKQSLFVTTATVEKQASWIPLLISTEKKEKTKWRCVSSSHSISYENGSTFLGIDKWWMRWNEATSFRYRHAEVFLYGIRVRGLRLH